MKAHTFNFAIWMSTILFSDAQSMVWPIPNPVISQQYGERDDLKESDNPSPSYRAGRSTHAGIDFSSKIRGADGKALGGDSIYPAAQGVVAKIYQNGPNSPLGNAVIINHPDLGSVYSVYGHLKEVYVSGGQGVTTSTILGAMGGTADGTVEQIHLHFEVKNRPTDYSSSGTEGAPKYWGYTPGHPDLYGYMDPLRFIRSDYGPEQFIEALPLLNSLNRGVAVRNHPGDAYASQESKEIWFIDSWQAVCATKRVIVNGEEWVFVNIPSRNQSSTVTAVHGPTGGWAKRSELVALPPSRGAIYKLKDTTTSGMVIGDQPSPQASEVARAFPGQCLVTKSSQSAMVNGEKWIAFDLPELSMRQFPVAEPLSSTTGWVRIADLNVQADLLSIAMEIVDHGSGVPEANSSITIDGKQVGITDGFGWIWIKLQGLGSDLLKTLVSKADAATLEIDPVALVTNPTVEVKPAAVPATSSRFVIGDSVFTGNTGVGLRGRHPDATSSTYNVLPDGSQGTIVGGPDTSDGYNRWRIRFTGFAYDMWCAEGEPGSATHYLNKNRVGTAPASPSGLSANVASSSQINLSWADNSANETGFQIERRLNPSGTWEQIATPTAGVTTYSSAGLSGGTTYDFRVRAYNSTGPSGFTNTASAKTIASATSISTLIVNAINLSTQQALAVNMYSWEGASTDFRANTTSFSRSAAGVQKITVSAPATLTGGRIFQYWLRDGSWREYNTAVTVSMDGPHALIAIYDITLPTGRTLQSISILGPSSVDESSTASYSARATYTDGTTGTVSAIWSESSSYAGISSSGLLDADAVSSDKSVTITATATLSGVTKSASKTVTIRNTDTASTYTLSLNVDGGGSIGYSPKASTYAAGTVVSLHGNRDAGWLFSHWSGDASGTEDDTTIRMDGNRSVTAHFVADASEGSLLVNISPPQAVIETAQWKYRNYTAWRDSGNTQGNIPVGTGYVNFKDIPGWITPDNMQATILGGQTIIVNAAYREIKGAVQVTITPPEAAQAGARWRLNGGAWQESGGTLADTPTGTNTIEFFSIPGWSTAPTQTITISRGVTNVLTGDYTPPAGFPIITSIAPRNGPITGGTTVTIEGVNFQPGSTVSFAGVPATSVAVSSPSRITAVTPARSSYGTVPLVLTCGGQSITQSNGFSYLNPLGSNIELVGQFGGNVEAVTMLGNLCYYGEGTSLVIADYTNPAAPVERGRIPLPGILRGITVSGGTAYVANQNAGLYAVDVSLATAPSIIGFYDTESSAQSVVVDGSIAYVADGDGGLVMLDVANPSAMFRVGGVDTAGYAKHVAVGTIGGDKYAFIAESNLALRVFRVTDPPVAIEVANVPALSTSGFTDVKLVGTTLCVSDWQAGVKIFNASNPASLVQIGLRSGGGVAIDVVGQRLYACGSALRVADLSVMPTPPWLGTIVPDGSCSDITVSNGLAFAAMGRKGLHVFAVSNPASMALRSRIDVVGDIEEIMVDGNVALIGNASGLHTVDISNPARPLRLASLPGDRVTEIVVAGGKATLVNYGDEIVRIANVANPASPGLLGTYSAVEAWNVALIGTTPVLAGATNDSAHCPKIDILSLSSPSNPQSNGSVLLDSVDDYADSIDIRGGWAFVGRSYNSVDLVNLANAASPQKVGSIPAPNLYGDVAASEDGNTLYIPDGQAGFRVVDVSNKANPAIIRTVAAPLDFQPELRHLRVSGRFLFAHSGRVRRPLYVFDLSNPTDPMFAAHYSNAGLVNSIHSTGDLIYISDSYGGASILRLLDVDKPTVSIVSPTTNSDYPTSNSMVTLAGMATDLQGVVRVIWENDRGGGGMAQGTTSWSIADIQLAAGVNVITVTAEDAQGNLARDSFTVTATLPETEGPALLITGPQLPPAFTFTSAMLPLTGTAADVSGVQTVDWANDRGGSGSATGTMAWNATIPLQFGPNRITLTALDILGNEMETELLVTYLPPDTTAPSISITFPTAATEFTMVQGTLNISGDASDDRGMKRITWSNNRGGSGTAAGTGPWAVNGIPLQPGLNSITLTAEDETGNTSQDNVAVTYAPYDADSDGIADDWEIKYFGGLAQASAGSDAGSIGTSDFLKFAMGIDPQMPDMSSLPRIERSVEAGTASNLFKYRRLVAPGNIVYRIGVSENLRDWDWSQIRLEEVGIPTPTGDGVTEEVTVRFASAGEHSPESMFFRLNVMTAPDDADGDGIPDWWEVENFGNLGIASATTDSGSIGIPDLLKFAFGINPAAPDRTRPPQLILDSTSGTVVPLFVFHQLVSPGTLIYQVGVSDDLQSWDWSGEQLTKVGSPKAVGDGLTERVTVTLRQPSAVSGPKFLRLRVISAN